MLLSLPIFCPKRINITNQSTKRFWRPPKGNIVFFESGTGGDLNHVVFSLGPNDNNDIEVVSFGEELESPSKVAVTKKTIAQLRQQGHTAVKFLVPFWDN